MVMPRPRPHALPRAVLFDAYGTLFDVHSVALLAEQLFPGQGERLSLLWRERQIDYTRLLTMSGRYRPFWEVTRAALRFAALRLALPLDAAGEDRLMNQYRHLSAFPEARDVLAALHRAAVPAGILSNGDPDMLAVAVKSAGFAATGEELLGGQRDAVDVEQRAVGVEQHRARCAGADVRCVRGAAAASLKLVHAATVFDTLA